MFWIRQRQSTNRPTGLVASAFAVLGVVAVCAVAPSFSTLAAAQVGELTFGNGKAAFAPPPGFKTLTGEQLKQLLPTMDSRAQVIGDPTRGSTIVYLLNDIKLTPAQMDMFRRNLSDTYTNANPSIKWVVNTLDTVGGRDGVRMEFSDDRQMYHISLTGYVDDQHSVMITYNIPMKELATLEPALRASIASLRITP